MRRLPPAISGLPKNVRAILRAYGGEVDISALPGPLRHFLAQLDELRSVGVPDMDMVGRLLVDLAADEDYLGPLIAEIPSEEPGGSGWSSRNEGPASCCSTGLRG